MIGIVIPAYNEDKNIGELIQKIRSVLGAVPADHLICVVDDSLDDKTEKILQSMSIKYIHRAVRDGRGSAVIDGLKLLLTTPCDIFVEMDADFSHNPQELVNLINKSRTEKLDLLIASRYLGTSVIENWPITRRLFSKCANLMAKFLLCVPVSDYTNGYRVYSRRAAELIAEKCGKIGKGFIPLSEILVQIYYNGLFVGETSTKFVNRLRGESSLNFKEISNAFFGIWKINALKRQLKTANNVFTGLQKWRKILAKYPVEAVIGSLTFVASTAMLFILYAKFGPEFYTKAGSTDTTGYLSIGKSLVEEGVYRMEGVISGMRTPGYPLFLAFFYLIHAPLWLIPVVQNIIAATNAILVYRFGSSVVSKKAGIIAALMFGLEPFNLYHSNIIMTETLFIFFLFITLLIFSDWYIAGQKKWHPYLLGIMLGITILTRPLVIFFIGIFSIFILYKQYVLKKFNFNALKPILIFVVCVVLVLTPWSLRQKRVFGSYALTNLDTGLLYTRVFPIVMAEEWGVSVDAAYKRLMAELPQKYENFSFKDFDHTFVYTESLKKEMNPVLVQHIPALIKYYCAALFPSGVISTGYQKFFNLFYPRWYINDPDLLGMMKSGQYMEIIKSILFADNFQKILLWSGVVWVSIYLIMVAGFVRAWALLDRSLLIFVVSMIIFFVVFSIGPPVFPRYRMISYPFIFLLFGYFFEKFRLKRRS